MENVAINEVKNEVVLENKEIKETVEQEVLTFELVRNSHDAIDVKFSAKPCREILNRLNEGYTKRSERFNWFNGVWSTFRFNTSKEANREGKDQEMLECKMFIEKIISEPLTMTDEEAQNQRKEMLKEIKANKASKSTESSKNTKKEEKPKKEAKKSVKKGDSKKEKAENLKKELVAYLKTLNMTYEGFRKMPKEAQQMLLIGMPQKEEKGE